MSRSSTVDLIKRLEVIARDARAEASAIEACLVDASGRLRELHAALLVLAPMISAAAGKASRKSASGKAFRAAANVLIGEVLA